MEISIFIFAQTRRRDYCFGIIEDKDKREIKIIGTDILNNLQEKLANLVNNEMSFIIRPTYHILEIEKKTLLAVFIPECPDQFKPCYYKPLACQTAHT